MTADERRKLVEAPLPTVRVVGSHYAGAASYCFVETALGTRRPMPVRTMSDTSDHVRHYPVIQGYCWGEILSRGDDGGL